MKPNSSFEKKNIVCLRVSLGSDFFLIFGLLSHTTITSSFPGFYNELSDMITYSNWKFFLIDRMEIELKYKMWDTNDDNE